MRTELNRISGLIIDSAIRVHSTVGPGLLESAYEAFLIHELKKRGLRVESQVPLPVVYDGVRVDLAYRIDLLVEGEVIVELKTVDSILAVHQAQVISYLKLSSKKLGLLINFKAVLLKDGIKRFANKL